MPLSSNIVATQRVLEELRELDELPSLRLPCHYRVAVVVEGMEGKVVVDLRRVEGETDNKVRMKSEERPLVCLSMPVSK
jgi:hypothetical protein